MIKMQTTEYTDHTEMKKGLLMTPRLSTDFRVVRVFRGLLSFLSAME